MRCERCKPFVVWKGKVGQLKPFPAELLPLEGSVFRLKTRACSLSRLVEVELLMEANDLTTR